MANYRKKKSSVVPAVAQSKAESISPRGLRVAEVAAYTSATVCMVRAAIKSGELPALLLGKRHVILREDVDAWLNSFKKSAA